MLEYVLRRNGLPLGAPGSLRAMLNRSLGARSPRIFWLYWNPVFGYYLGKYVYSNIRKLFSSSVSIMFTFVVSGLIHDLATFAMSGSTRYFFALWFFNLSVGVIITEFFMLDLSGYNKSLRIAFNLFYISACFGITYIIIYALLADGLQFS